MTATLLNSAEPFEQIVNKPFDRKLHEKYF